MDILHLLENFKRSPGQSNPSQDSLAIRAAMAVRRIRARGEISPRDRLVITQIREFSQEGS